MLPGFDRVVLAATPRSGLRRNHPASSSARAGSRPQDSAFTTGSSPGGAYQSGPSQPLTSLKYARRSANRWWIGDSFASRFPGIFAVCMARGIDPRRTTIPVTPAAHYTMGGVATDLDGHTSIARLFAVGEVACTGVHGANRLASNSLLEGLVFAERVARAAVEASPLDGVPERQRWAAPLLRDEDAALAAADAIRALMWEHAGIERTSAGLRSCLEALRKIAASLAESAIDAANMALTARLITEAALLREESRGGHYRADFPLPRRAFAVHRMRSRTSATEASS